MKFPPIMTVLSGVLASTALTASAADYSGDIHKHDSIWSQFNLMYAYKELPRPKDAKDGHDYLEVEFGGRNAILHYYGYVDVFNLTNSKDSDKYGASKLFMKLVPRFSLDAITGKDLSFGPVKELYFSTLFAWGGGGGHTKYTVTDKDCTSCTPKDYKKEVVIKTEDTNNSFWGIGADIDVPWFGTVGLNLYGLYDINKKAWNGYQVSTNWFKPFYFFENDSFISYQGYIDWQFAKDKFEGNKQASNGGQMFNGFFWHSKQWAVGYGLKLYKDVYLIEDSKALKSTGVAHYFDITYKL